MGINRVVLGLVVVLAAGPAHGQEKAPEAAKDTPADSQETVDAVTTAPAPPVPTPLEQLKSSVDSERYNAAIALGKAGNKQATLALMEVLGRDRNASVRGAAAWSLGALLARVAVPNLRQAADKDTSPKVRLAATKALLAMGVAPEKRPEPVRVIQQAPAVDPLDRYYNDAEYSQGRRMRTSGMVLFIVGGTLGPIIGGIMLNDYIDDERKAEAARNNTS